MSKITKEEILKVSKLAKLKLSHDEVDTYTKQLEGVLEYFAKLKEVNTDNIDPMYYPNEGMKRVSIREDKAQQTNLDLKSLNLVKVNGKDYFVVPRVL